MNNAPLITIVVPVYNRAGIVKRTLQSIEAQTIPAFNVVLVDNNSSDNTREVLMDWAQHVSQRLYVELITCRQSGASAARNAGLARVRTPWVMFFDSDDTMSPGHIERILRAISANPLADVVGWDVLVHSLNGKVTKKYFRNSNLLFDCIHHASFATQRYVCRTDLIRDCGAWDASAYVWVDIELGTRLITRYPDINVVKLKGAPTVDVYESPVSITGQNFHARSFEREHSLDLMSRALTPYQQYMVNLKRIILAANYRREGFREDAILLKAKALSLTSGLWHKTLLRIAYHYTALGGRGAASLLYYLF